MPESNINQQNQPPSQQTPASRPFFKKPIWIFVLLVELVIIIGGIGYVAFKNINNGDSSLFKIPGINNSKDKDSPEEISTEGKIDDSVMVMLDTFKKPEEKYTLYRVQLDGSREEELWSFSFKNDDRMTPPNLIPPVSHNRKLLVYGSALKNEFNIINAITGRERKIPKKHPSFFGDFDCVWNNADTHIACAIRENKSTDFDQLLIVVDINNGDEIVVNDSTKDQLIFGKNSPVRILGWGKKDQQIYLSSTRGDNTVLLSVDTNTKKVTSYEVGEKNIIRFFNAKYSAELNKFILDADRESTLYTFDPENSKKELLYEYKGKFIEGPIYLSGDGKVILFKENNFEIGFGQSSDPKDGESTSKIIKINLETGKKQEFDYPFDPNELEKKRTLSRLDFYDFNSNTVVISNSTFSGTGFEDLKLVKVLYSYNLDSKKQIKIFSRDSDDFPDKDFQYDVIP